MTDATAAVSPLRRRMIDDMSLRNLSPATQRSYLHAVTKFSRFHGRSPDRLGLEDVRAFQVHLMSQGISWPALNHTVCALRFFYGVTLDLRARVVGAVADGISCRAAAARFGVSAASAVRWRQRAVREGSPAPRRQGGDRRSGRIDAHGDLIRAAVAATPDMTLEELQAMLRGHGVSFGIGTLWRFFDRHGITRKTRPRTPPNRTGPTY